MLRDDLIVELPDEVGAVWEAALGRARVRDLRTAKKWRYLPQVCREFLDNFEDDPQTVILIPKSVIVRINRATLGELRSWRTHMQNTTVPTWKHFLDTFEVSDSRLERVAAGVEEDPYRITPRRVHPVERPTWAQHGTREATEFRLRPYREVLTLEVDDPCGDDIAADAPRRPFAGGGEP